MLQSSWLSLHSISWDAYKLVLCLNVKFNYLNTYWDVQCLSGLMILTMARIPGLQTNNAHCEQKTLGSLHFWWSLRYSCIAVPASAKAHGFSSTLTHGVPPLLTEAVGMQGFSHFNTETSFPICHQHDGLFYNPWFLYPDYRRQQDTNSWECGSGLKACRCTL